MYIPHGNYPPDAAGFNSTKHLPELFKDIDFRKFALLLSRKGLFWDFTSSEMFLYSSLYQENYGAKLIMLLSAVERVSGKWEPIENILRSSIFKNKMHRCSNVQEAYSFMVSEIEKYIEDFGSFRKIIRFYADNLSKTDKELIVNGIKMVSYFKKYDSKEYGVVYKTEPIEAVPISDDNLDMELSIRLKQVIYHFRNCFVHKAEYIPYPDDKSTKDNPFLGFVRYESNIPKEEWAIFLKFEALHEITRKAFINYWINLYENLSKEQFNK